jgi:hypothetical protein
MTPDAGLPVSIRLTGLVDGKLQFDVNCRSCGGWVLDVEDTSRLSSPVRCKACDSDLGRWGSIRFAALGIAKQAGYEVSQAITDHFVQRANEHTEKR